jgi:precorrin-6A/cobalt-precorrin-6A reductase
VPDPALPAGLVRIGGFGGVEGLRDWLVDNDITAVVDATHPFAATMTANAAQACAEVDLPHLVLHRPPWDPAGATMVRSDTEAAEVVAAMRYSRVFLTTGRSGVAAFSRSDAWFLIRVVTAPDAAALPANYDLVFSRGPYYFDDECELMRSMNIEVLVTKNSGGPLTEAKLDAARDLDIDVIMIDRPALPARVKVVDSVQEAVYWLKALKRTRQEPPIQRAGP